MTSPTNTSGGPPPNRARVPQTWENTSLIPFLRQYYRFSDRYPNADMEAEVAKARRILDALDIIRNHPDRVHSLVLGIAVPPLNPNGTVQPALYPNSDTPQGEENRLLVALVLLQHARLAPPIWLPPREPAERVQAPLRSRQTGPQVGVTYPVWTEAEALAFQPRAPDPSWMGDSDRMTGRGGLQQQQQQQGAFAGNLNTPFGRGGYVVAGGAGGRGGYHDGGGRGGGEYAGGPQQNRGGGRGGFGFGGGEGRGGRGGGAGGGGGINWNQG